MAAVVNAPGTVTVGPSAAGSLRGRRGLQLRHRRMLVRHPREVDRTLEEPAQVLGQLARLREQGFTRVKVDGEQRLLEEDIVLDKKFKHDIAVVVDRLVMKDDLRRRLENTPDLLRRGRKLQGVSLAVKRGEVVGLAGLLGSGRTETARAIFGADPIDVAPKALREIENSVLDLSLFTSKHR